MRTVREANRYLGGQVKNGLQFATGLCKRKCRQAYLIESDGTQTAKAAAWKTQHRFTEQWITGAFAWWTSDGAGHVAICCYRKGYVFTTDVKRPGHWDVVRIEEVSAAWPGHKFLFFSRDIDGKTPVKLPRIIRRYRYPR